MQLEDLTSVNQHCLSFISAAGNCNGDVTCRDDFFSDPVAIGYYKDHVKKLINRVNTFNQRLYRCAYDTSLCFGRPACASLICGRAVAYVILIQFCPASLYACS